ncbi:hypothetical protein HHI36_019919 [Cryptolaemus montrouzieri]|uniref:Uncharacterized protein n=1 Tax=Cryptolaemus montrouzieri TaxID=559131 RepID=A0ABD2N9T8_9CUCU
MNGDTEGSTSTIAEATQSKTPITSRPGSNRKRKKQDDLSTEVLTTVRDHFKTPREQLDRYDLIEITAAVRIKGLEKRLALIAEKKMTYYLRLGYLRTLLMPHYVSSASNSCTPSPSTMYNVHGLFPEAPNGTTGYSSFQSLDNTTASNFSQFSDN